MNCNGCTKNIEINKESYQKLVDEDLEWLDKMPNSLEKHHIETIVKWSVQALYGPEIKMKIDFDHFKGHQIADDYQHILDEQSEIQLISMLKPEFNMDGNMFCFTYPSRDGLPNDCIQGFGATASEAARDFNKNWYNWKAHGGNRQ